MIFDSEAQKQRVIDLIGEVPVQTTIKGVLSGPSTDLLDLMNQLACAYVVDVDQQTVLLIELAEREHEGGEG